MMRSLQVEALILGVFALGVIVGYVARWLQEHNDNDGDFS